jgi:hypothetical protein
MLIEAIAEALDGHVLPAVAKDQWSASTVRSAVTILRHLAKRVELEGGILAEDTADAQAVLTALLPGVKDAGLKAEVDAVLGAAEPSPHDTAAMDAHNTRYQHVFDLILRQDYAGAWTTEAAQPVRGAIRAYLRRRMAREKVMYIPEFSGPPF